MILSISVAPAYALLALLNKPYPQTFLPFVFGGLLTVAEGIRSLLLSLLYLGEGTTVGFHFNAGTIGNALSSTPLVEFAYFGGTFALTFTLGYLVYCLCDKKRYVFYVWHIFAVAIFLAVTHYLIPVTTPPQKITVGVITVDTPDEATEEKVFLSYTKSISHIYELTNLFASSSPTIIVYPEDTRFIDTLPKETGKKIRETFPTTLFVDGSVYPHSGKFSNVSVFMYPTKEKFVARGKEFLMPFNEYIPYFFSHLITLFIPQKEIATYKAKHTFIPLHTTKVITVNGLRVATLICSELLSYEVLSSLKQERPDIVLYQSRLQIFHNNPWFVMHLRSFSKVAAAQLRTTMVSSSNGAPSYFISPHGTIIDSLPPGFSATLYTIK